MLRRLALLTILITGLGARFHFQLVDSSGNYILDEQEGLLLYSDGTVCDDHFNETAAQAVCRSMGYDGAVTWTVGSKWQLQSRYYIRLDDVMCASNDWSSCNHGPFGAHNCAHDEDVFLKCSGTRSQFALVDKRGYQTSGTQQFLLLFNGGTVCGDGFTNNSANAICRDMGYSDAESWRLGLAWNLGYRIALDDVNCTEGDWRSCSYTTSHNCVHGKDVYISCRTAPHAPKHRLEYNKTSRETLKNEPSDTENLAEKPGESVAISILILVCITLVVLLVKKNTQIDNLIKKNTEIDSLVKKYAEIDNIVKKLGHIEFTLSEETSEIKELLIKLKNSTIKTM